MMDIHLLLKIHTFQGLNLRSITHPRLIYGEYYIVFLCRKIIFSESCEKNPTFAIRCLNIVFREKKY